MINDSFSGIVNMLFFFQFFIGRFSWKLIMNMLDMSGQIYSLSCNIITFVTRMVPVFFVYCADVFQQITTIRCPVGTGIPTTCIWLTLIMNCFHMARQMLLVCGTIIAFWTLKPFFLIMNCFNMRFQIPFSTCSVRTHRTEIRSRPGMYNTCM